MASPETSGDGLFLAYGLLTITAVPLLAAFSQGVSSPRAKIILNFLLGLIITAPFVLLGISGLFNGEIYIAGRFSSIKLYGLGARVWALLYLMFSAHVVYGLCDSFSAKRLFRRMIPAYVVFTILGIYIALSS